MSVVSTSFRARVRSSIETPVAAFFGRLGFSPNALTLIGFGIAVVGAYFAARQSWLIAGLIVAFGAIFDLFDGALARATGKVSKFGAFLDSTTDRLGEAVVYIGIVVGLYDAGSKYGPILAMTAMAAAFMVSYVRARAEGLGYAPGSGFASVGIAPREIRTAILVIGLVISPWTLTTLPFLASVDDPVLNPASVPLSLSLATALIAAFSILTTIQRILFVYRQSKSQEVTK